MAEPQGGALRPQGLDFAEEAMRDLEREHSDTKWHFYSTGHSLGALMATALAIQEAQKVERCCLRCSLCAASHARSCSALGGRRCGLGRDGACMQVRDL